ncbi:hypothetical protein AB4Y86_08520 [Arthrobacter sp. 2YAF22_2]
MPQLTVMPSAETTPQGERPAEAVTEAPSPSASATAAALPSAAPSKTPAPVPVQAAPVIQAAVAAATGSPFGVQLVTVLILLGAGLAYFRALGGKGARTSPKAGK